MAAAVYGLAMPDSSQALDGCAGRVSSFDLAGDWMLAVMEFVSGDPGALLLYVLNQNHHLGWMLLESWLGLHGPTEIFSPW